MTQGGSLVVKAHVRTWTYVVASCLVAIAVLLVPSLARANDRLVVGVPSDRCPISYPDPQTGEPVGIGVDLMRLAAQESGFDASFEFIGSQTIKDALDNPSYDVVLPFGSAIKSASGQASVVTENLMRTPFTIVTPSNRNVSDVSTAQVGMLSSQSGVAETVKQLYPNMKISLYDTMDECVSAVRSNEVEALLHNSYVWSYVLQKPAYSDLEVKPTAMFSMDFRAGTLDTPDGRAMVERLNEGIAKLDDTRVQAVALDYTSRHLYRYDVFDYIHQYGVVIALVGALFVSIIVISIQRRRALVLRQEERVRHMEDHDALTGALSLHGFRSRARELLRKNLDSPYILVYANIRNFKYVNDSMGMDAGDDLLKFMSDRMDAFVSSYEAFCRVGGDHFALLVLATGDKSIARLEHLVINPVRSYFIDRGNDQPIQVSGGVYVISGDDRMNGDIDHMLDFARVAEKRARKSKQDGYEFYNPDQWTREKWTAGVVAHLPKALSGGEIMVWYQPQVDFGTGSVVGAEALCRWNHSTLGWLSPADFIPALEESGLIFDLDRYVWDTACRDLARWNAMGHRMAVSVNMSRCDTWGDVDIPELFAELVREHGIDPDQLRIEVTESAFVEDTQLLVETTARLRELGFAVEMDDFGSGYSSLHMLKEVPVDRIKLDLRFLSDQGDLQRGRIIVSTMIELVERLGMDIIAEGVETEEQAVFLSNHHCNVMQGYWFYRPMIVGDFEQEIVFAGDSHDGERS